jgi:sensor histidine kinase YesM
MSIVWYLSFTKYSLEQQYTNRTILLGYINEIAIKIKLIESIADNIASNSQLVEFLQMKNYNDYMFYITDYREKIYPIVQYAMIPKIKIQRINVFFSSTILPEGFGIFYRDNLIKKHKWVKEFVLGSDENRWVYLQGKELDDFLQLVNPAARGVGVPIFLHLKKIKNWRGNYIGFIAIQIYADDLFNVTVVNNNRRSFFIFDDTLRIINSSFNFEKLNLETMLQKTVLRNMGILINTANRIGVYQRIYQLGNFYAGYITKKKSTSTMLITILFVGPIALFSFPTILLVYMFVRSIFNRLNKSLEIVNYSIMHGFKYRLKVKENDEIDEINQKFNILIEKVEKLLEENVKKETAHIRAELKALQYQLNPHFIYNTLEIFASKLELEGKWEVAEAISDFSNLLRYILKNEQLYSAIKDEVEYIKSFISIYKIRYENRIVFHYEIPEELTDVKIPRFILLPLIENCIYHGMDKNLKNELTINLRIWSSSPYLHIEITDNGKGISQEGFLKIAYRLQYKRPEKDSDIHLAIGIVNIHNRMRILFKGNYQIIIESKRNEGTKIKLIFPINEVILND